ncbi:hypothetical protein ACFTUC_34980 [Streptomyces sp. NPDC056944]
MTVEVSDHGQERSLGISLAHVTFEAATSILPKAVILTATYRTTSPN